MLNVTSMHARLLSLRISAVILMSFRISLYPPNAYSNG